MPIMNMNYQFDLSKKLKPFASILYVAVVAVFFGMAEIQIEGANGWAAGLPTWRIESHWLLDIFWGSRPMTGYHAWIFSFMALVFHWPVFATGRWSPRFEARILGSLMIFWIIEDFSWFLFNPGWGWAKFSPAFIPWHKKWLFGLPLDYVTFTIAGALLLAWSWRNAPETGVAGGESR